MCINQKFSRCICLISSSLGGLSFTIVDGEPYVKVGADTPRPFKSGVTITQIGTGGNGTYDATIIENYQSLTVDNFAFIPTGISSTGNSSGTYPGGTTNGRTLSAKSSASASPTMSYDASTGKLTVSGCSKSSSTSTSNSSDGMLQVKSSTTCSVSGKIMCYS